MNKYFPILISFLIAGLGLYTPDAFGQSGPDAGNGSNGYNMGSQMGSGTMGQGYGGGTGGGMMGQGHGYDQGMGPGRGYYGMGPGMMGPGYGYGQQNGQPNHQLEKPLNKEQARQEVRNYLDSTKNPNLKIGEIQEKGNDYEVNVVTQDGSLANKILVDKNTGQMRSAY